MKFSKKSIVQLLLSVMLLIVASAFLNAQTKYIDKKGSITFEASEELFEPVKATNASVTVILNSETSEIASLALMKGFRFKNSLMEEHFNENYIESETYPKATFRGKLVDFNSADLSVDTKEIMVNGKIKLRGKEKEVSTPLKVSIADGVIMMQGSFKVKPEDFDIEIPNIVKNKIAKEIIVSLDFKLVKK